MFKFPEIDIWVFNVFYIYVINILSVLVVMRSNV